MDNAIPGDATCVLPKHVIADLVFKAIKKKEEETSRETHLIRHTIPTPENNSGRNSSNQQNRFCWTRKMAQDVRSEGDTLRQAKEFGVRIHDCGWMVIVKKERIKKSLP